MSEALKVLLASIAAFNQLAPAAAQIIAIFRKADGTEIPLNELIEKVVAKNDANIEFAEEYLRTHPPTA
jgi:hypothetical protein